MTLPVDVNDPNFGRLIPCDCKIREMDQRNFADLERFSRLDAFASKTFEAFDPQIKGVHEAYQAALDYARDLTGWLMMVGDCGTGKTHLAAAIAGHATRHRSLKTLFTIVPDLLDHLRATYHPSSPVTYDERFEAIRTVPLLVLDDLGTENQTPWALEKLYQIVNHRYNEQLPTVITSNVDIDSLERRIRSRLLDTRLCRHVFIDAEDYRRRDLALPKPSRPRQSAGGGERVVPVRRDRRHEAGFRLQEPDDPRANRPRSGR